MTDWPVWVRFCIASALTVGFIAMVRILGLIHRSWVWTLLSATAMVAILGLVVTGSVIRERAGRRDGAS
jgi:hypothetical protein